MNFDKSVGIVCFILYFFPSEKTELTIEDKYKRTMQEIECLKDELGKFFCLSRGEYDIATAEKNNLKHVNHIPQPQDPKSLEGLKTLQIV